MKARSVPIEEIAKNPNLSLRARDYLYCANDPCEAEAYYLIEETMTPLCKTCGEAYLWGQAGPHNHLRMIEGD